MAQFDSIAFGENKWNDKVNSNFSKVIQDSGAIPFVFVAPASGTMTYRVVNGFLTFSGNFKTGSTDATTIGYLPKLLGTKNFLAKDMTTSSPVSASIDSTGALAIKCTSATDNINLDGASLYVGYVNLTNLWGGRTPLKPLIAGFKAILRTIGGGLDVIR